MKTFDITPIETEWRGYRFRSRAEARWAVFFEAYGIKYEYEPEGFVLPNGKRYLPDFYLPEMNLYGTKGAFAEVKGIFTEDEINTCRLLCKTTKKAVFLLEGSPDFVVYRYYNYFPEFPAKHRVCFGEGQINGIDNSFWICDDRAMKYSSHPDKINYNKAVFASRAARFETF